VRSNIITKALQEIQYTIPKEVLEAAFLPSNPYLNPSAESIEGGILRTVIYPRVIMDCNLTGGQMMEIDLSYCPSNITPDSTVIFKVPKNLTNGKSIITALSVYEGTNVTSSGFNLGSGNPLVDLASRGMSGGTSAPFNARIELIGENTVAIKYTSPISSYGVLRVIVENDEHMSNIPPRLWHLFSELCVLATKSYIFNKFEILQSKAELYAGAPLDTFRSVVDRYSDAEEAYKTKLKEEWWKASFMIDETTHGRFLKLKLNPGL